MKKKSLSRLLREENRPVRRKARMERIVPGHRNDGDLVLEEVEETEASLGETREALRILARWLARAALDQEKSRKSRKPREIQAQNPALFT